MKHIPFESIYREEFEVVEQRSGHLSHYPHTEQLPLLWRALNLEFLGGLPGRYARVDRRGNAFDKLVRGRAALYFCTNLNGERKDQLRLFDLPDPDLVQQVTIVQQISEDHPLGRTHRFRFYGGEHFFPEIRLSGKRVVFADHVLQRFSARVPNRIGSDLTNLLVDFFGTPIISLPVGHGRAFLVGHEDSILAFTYKESADEFFITTCLTVNEINTLAPELYPHAYNLHYGARFTKPRFRSWIPVQWMVDYYSRWEKKIPFRPPREPITGAKERRLHDWRWVAHHIKDVTLKNGHGPGSQLCFLDQIPGPCLTEIKPGGNIPEYDELKIYREISPQFDWDTLMAERVAEEARGWNGAPPPATPANDAPPRLANPAGDSD